MNLPYAVINFAELRREKYFYADKTRFLPLLEDKSRGRPYALFLRPRRFGKSTFLSLLEHYYDVARADQFAELFTRLEQRFDHFAAKIARPSMPHAADNIYPPGLVSAIAPGTVLTERQRHLWFQTEAQVEAARAAQCLPDLIAPEDIANLALFLASDDSRLITKQTISVNAGVL